MTTNLLAALGVSDDLEDAACRGRSALFEDPERIDEAKLICETRCVAYQRCADYAARQRPNRIHGTWAGVWHEWSPTRRKAAS